MKPILLQSNKAVRFQRDEHAVSWMYSQGIRERQHEIKKNDVKSQKQNKQEKRMKKIQHNTCILTYHKKVTFGVNYLHIDVTIVS